MNLDIKSFYRQKFLQIRDQCIRRDLMSKMLLIFQIVQIQAIFLNESIFHKWNSNSTNGVINILYIILQYSKIYPWFSQEKANFNKIYFIDLSFGFALITIVTLLIIILLQAKLSQIKQHQKSGLQEFLLTDQQSQLKELPITLQKLFQYSYVILSLFIQFYKYILHWSTISASLEILKYYINDTLDKQNWICIQGMLLSILNLILYCLADWFLVFHNFDYKFKNEDQMGQNESNLNILLNIYLYISIIIISFTQQNDIPSINLILGIVLILYQIILSTFQLVYRKQSLNFLQSIILGQFLFFYFSILLYINNVFTAGFVNNILLLSCPIIFQIQFMIHQKVMKSPFQINPKQKYLFDQKLRIIYNLIKETFQQDLTTFKKPIIRSYLSLQLHSIVANHLRNCQGIKNNISNQITQNHVIIKKCFCKVYFPISDDNPSKFWQKHVYTESEESFFAFKNEKFKKFLYDLIRHYFEEYLNSKQAYETSTQFSYIYFLFQILKRPTKAFYEAMNLKLKIKNISIKKSMIIEQLIEDAKYNFNTMIQKKDLKNQKYNFYQVFQFDQNLALSKYNFIVIFSNLKKWYNQLLAQKIILDQVIKKGSEILQQIHILDKQLQFLYKINPTSTELDSIYYLYYKYINFNNRRPKSTKRDSPYANTFIQSLNQQVFQIESAVVYISLMNQRGSIQNYTKSFKKLVMANDSDIKQKNIKEYMPDSIAQYHDMYLDNFIELGRMNIVMAEQRFLIVKNKSSFIMPVHAKVRLENYSNDDFGSSALITRINQQHYYAMISKYGQIEEISENFFEDILSKTLNISPLRIKSINFFRIMPCLLNEISQYVQGEDDEIDFEFNNQKKDQINYNILLEGHIIIPKNGEHRESLYYKDSATKSNFSEYYMTQTKINQKYISNVENAYLFTVKYKIRLMKTINHLYNILEIQNLKMVKSENYRKTLKILETKITHDDKSPTRIVEFEESEQYELDNKIQDQGIFRKSQTSGVEYDLEDDLIYQIEQMITEKSNNIKFLITGNNNDNNQEQKFNNNTQQLYTLDSQIMQQQKSSFLTQENLTRQFAERKSSSQLGQVKRYLEEESHQESKDSQNQESSSVQKLQKDLTYHQDGQSSIGSSQQYNDYITKRKMMRDVLLSDHQFQGGWTKFSIIGVSFMLVLILYVINFIFVIITNNDLNDIQNNKNIPQKIFTMFHSFILVNQFLNYESHLQEWYEQIQNFSVLNYQNNIEYLLNQQNGILDSSFFNQKQLFYMDSNETQQELDQLFIYKLIDEVMISKITLQYESQYLNSTNIIIDNYQSITNMILQLNQSLYISIQNNLDNFQENEDILLIISEVSLTIILLILIPTLFMINQQKGVILDFFATLSSNEIQQQYETYEALFEKFDQMKFISSEANELDLESQNIRSLAKQLQTLKDFSSKKQITTTKLKRSIGSNTTPMIMFTILLFIIFTSIVSAYFIASYSTKIQFLNEYQNIYSEMIILDSLSSQILNENSAQQIILDYYINQIEIPYQFQDIINDKSNSNFTSLTYFSNQLLQILQSKSGDFKNIVSQDICYIFNSSYLNYLENQDYLLIYNYQQCLTYNDIQQGLSLIITEFINQLLSFYLAIENYKSNEITLDSFQQQIRLLNPIQMQDLYLYTYFTFQIILDADQYKSQNLIDSNLQTQIIIFIVGIAFMFIFFWFAESYFKQLLTTSINRSKQLLTLVPFEILQANAYVMTYVVQESKKRNL